MSAAETESVVGKPLRFMVGEADLNGTCIQGFLNVPFRRLVEVFGEPSQADGYKVAFQWAITFSDGTVASIYDYKASSLYDDENQSPEQMRASNFSDWHIGGKTPRAAELVRLTLEKCA